MGRFFGTQICQWQVVTGRIVAAHQPPQAISSLESGSRGFWGTGQKPYIWITWQPRHTSTRRGDSISSSEQADVGHSDLLSGSWNFSDTNLSPGSGQSECGRSFQGSGVKGVVPESSGGQQDTQVDLFASREWANLPVYFSIYRKDRRAEGSMIWFRGESSRRIMCFHHLNWFCINMHGNQGLSGVTDMICLKHDPL